MKTIILGREGTQPFKIKNEDVSRQHAQITIDDHGEWVLEDLNSSNGTFIRNEKGDLVRVGRVNITPMTFICLGPDNSKGCFFYAKQVENYGDFREEYEYLTELEDEYDEKIEKLEEKEHTQKMIVFAMRCNGFAQGADPVHDFQHESFVLDAASVIREPDHMIQHPGIIRTFPHAFPSQGEGTVGIDMDQGILLDAIQLYTQVVRCIRDRVQVRHGAKIRVSRRRACHSPCPYGFLIRKPRFPQVNMYICETGSNHKRIGKGNNSVGSGNRNPSLNGNNTSFLKKNIRFLQLVLSKNVCSL